MLNPPLRLFFAIRLVQVSTIIGSNVYQDSDKPLYKKGNLAMTILAVCNCFLYGKSACSTASDLLSQVELIKPIIIGSVFLLLLPLEKLIA